MMLAVMELEGLGRHMRLERGLVERKRRQFESHDLAPLTLAGLVRCGLMAKRSTGRQTSAGCMNPTMKPQRPSCRTVPEFCSVACRRSRDVAAMFAPAAAAARWRRRAA